MSKRYTIRVDALRLTRSVLTLVLGFDYEYDDE